ALCGKRRRDAHRPLQRRLAGSSTESADIYTLSLHDALPIWNCATKDTCAPARYLRGSSTMTKRIAPRFFFCLKKGRKHRSALWRSEEHTSELQSRENLVCRLLLEKKKTTVCNIKLLSTKN